MTLAHPRAVAAGLRVAGGLLLGALFFTFEATSALAFCVENAARSRLFLAARIKGEAGNRFVVRRLVEGAGRICGAPERGSDIVEVFVFADEDSVESCDDEIAAVGTLRLEKFAKFDNCVWAKR